MSETWATRGTPELTPAGKQPLLTSIFQCSAEFLEQLRFYFEQNPPTIPISNIPGFAQFTVQQASDVTASETTTSTTYGNLTTTGPTITGLPDGKYVVLWGATTKTSNALYGARVGIKVDTTEPSDQNTILTGNVDVASLSRALAVTLSGSPSGGHTLLARYKVDNAAATGTFSARWLMALRYSNL